MLYDLALWCLSAVYYAVFTPFARPDEDHFRWFRRRLRPALPARGPRRPVWIHGVSLGETKVSALLASAIAARSPGLPVVVSSSTRAGYARAAAIADIAGAFVLPIDTRAETERVFAHLDPAVLVVIESEMWPNLFRVAARRGVPIIMANAIMAERSFRQRRRLPAAFVAPLDAVRRVFAQDSACAARFRGLGVPPRAIEVSGNLKLASGKPWRAEAADDEARGETIVFGNIHPDEVPRLVPAIRRVLAARAGARAILVPRHPAKFTEASVRATCGDEVVFTLDPGARSPAPRLAWVNAIGVLNGLYARARIGVVCGTFNDVGGHDLAEPFQMGALAVYGPNVSRQGAIHAALVAARCSVQVAGPDELGETLVRLLADPQSLCAPRIAAFGEAMTAAQSGLDSVTEAILDTASGEPGPGEARRVRRSGAGELL